VKVTGWTAWDNKKYKDVPNKYFKRAFDAVVKEIKEKGYKFSGTEHQEAPNGMPIIDDRYAFRCSCRMWGEIMSESYNLKESEDDTYSYVLWAWWPMIIGQDGDKPIFEEQKFPEEIVNE